MSDVRFFQPADPARTPISKCSIAGDFLYTWGYGEVIRIGHEKEDMRKVFEHIGGLLSEHGLDFSDVAKTTVLLTRLDHWDLYSEVYKEYFKPPYPCRTTIPVVTENAILEMDVVAYRKGLGEREPLS
jgi:enamine deaminase RidA (YjgF/YER057c/UK114 family)